MTSRDEKKPRQWRRKQCHARIINNTNIRLINFFYPIALHDKVILVKERCHMKIILADAMGICFGVRDAIAATKKIQHPTDITVFGQLVHNPLVTTDLERRGFSTLDESQRSAAAIQTSAVLITAHGISNRQRALLEADGKYLVDTTCPLVRRAHDAALALARDGYFVVVIGKRSHVEVRGLTGDLEPDCHAIIETAAEVRPYSANKIGIIAQTTSVERDAHTIVQKIREENPHADIKFINTICQPTRDRQRALERLLEKINILVVIGGKHSNNTRQLVAHAREKGVPAIHVESPEELREHMFHPQDTVGLTAGTSTLPETIESVKHALEQFHLDSCARTHASVSF